MTRIVTELKAANCILKNRVAALEKENKELKDEINRLNDSIANDRDP